MMYKYMNCLLSGRDRLSIYKSNHFLNFIKPVILFKWQTNGYCSNENVSEKDSPHHLLLYKAKTRIFSAIFKTLKFLD